MIRHLSTLIAALFLLAAIPTVHAQACRPVSVSAGDRVPVQPADAAGIRLVVRNAADSRDLPGAVPQNGVWEVTQPQLDVIKEVVAQLSADDRRAARLRTTNQAGELTAGAPIRFQLASESADIVCAVAAAGAAGNVITNAAAEPATAQQCSDVAATWFTGSRRYRVPILFNSKGTHCYSPPVIRQGDLLVVGMVLTEGEAAPKVISVDFAECPQESATPQILASGSFKDLALQSRTPVPDLEVRYLDARSCASESPVVTVKIGAGKDAVSTPYTLSQFKRYHATLHLGAVYTDLHEPDFGLRDEGGNKVIFNKDAEKRGPEYVATIVIQGVGHYFEKLFSTGTDVNVPDNWLYKGRDPVHDGALMDRIGLVISAGIQKPDKRFGLGLSFEVANGVNVIGLYEMAKIRRLEGVAIGDTFTGTADELPTREEWESKTSLGMTFDIAYITKLFSGSK